MRNLAVVRIIRLGFAAGGIARVPAAIATALALAAGIGACAVHNAGTGAADHEGHARKTWSGRSFKNAIVVEAAPTASPSAPGFDSERVWSGFDDWEPAIAADPSTSDVYQMTTRYDGPKPCKGCPLPAMIFRRSRDGGATWDPDKFMPVTKNPQNDPQIEVATDGTIYVAWIDGFTPGIRFSKSSDRGATW